MQNFISDSVPNVKGIVMAGSADFKTVVQNSGFWDKRFQGLVIGTYDVSYGFENGLSQAITMS